MKKTILLQLGVLIEVDETEIEKRNGELDNLKNGIIDCIDNFLEYGKYSKLGWRSCGRLVLGEKGINSYRCSKCNSWVSDMDKPNPIPELGYGARIQGKIYCDEDMPVPHRWEFFSRSKISVKDFDSESLFWPEGWERLTKDESLMFNKELGNELPHGHALDGLGKNAIGRKKDSDDILFVVLEESYYFAQVHLTWNKEFHPKWPCTKVFKTFQTWIDAIKGEKESLEKKDRCLEIVKNLKSENIPYAIISKATGMSEKDIEKI